MNKHVNLMSPRARVRECTRTRLRQWSRILAAGVGLIALHGAISWWPVHACSLQRAALEAQYEPVRQMKMENRSLTRKIADTLDESELELALSKQTPVVTLVGLVGRAVDDTEGKVFLDKFDYNQKRSNGPGGGTVSAVHLEGISLDPVAAGKFADLLKNSACFGNVQMGTVEAIDVNQQPMQTFQVDFSF